MPWMKFDPVEFAYQNLDLSCAELGMYMRLLAFVWQCPEGFKDDSESISRICRISQTNVRKLWPSVSAKFQSVNGKMQSEFANALQMHNTSISRIRKKAALTLHHGEANAEKIMSGVSIDKIRLEKNKKTSRSGSEKPEPKYLESDLNAAKYLQAKLIEQKPDRQDCVKNGVIPRWANEVRLMREQDKRSPADLKHLIDAVFDGTGRDALFWKKNLLSMGKVREKWDTVWERIFGETAVAPTPRGNNFKPDWYETT